MGRQVRRKWLSSRQTFSVLHKYRKLLLSNFFLLLILLLCGKKNKLCLSPPVILGSLQSCRAPSLCFYFSAFMLAPSTPHKVTWHSLMSWQWLSLITLLALNLSFPFPPLHPQSPSPSTSMINPAVCAGFVVTCFGLFHNLRALVN